MRARVLSVLAVALLLAACDEDPPTAPSPLPAGITVGAIVPQNGGTIIATGEPPGAMLLRGSNAVMIPLTLTAGRDLPFAELMVFLQDANGVDCGSNSPDRPTWAPFGGSARMTATITGFQVGRLPCAVARIRVILHTRNDPHLNTVPQPAQIVAETTIPTSFTIR
jgi:hypothetical protein